MSKAKRKSKLSPDARRLAGWAKANFGTPVTPVESVGRETLAGFTKQEQERQEAEQRRLQQEAEKPVRESERLLREASAELRAAQRGAIFAHPSSYLAANCETAPEIKGSELTAEDIRIKLRNAFDEFWLAAETAGVRFETSCREKMVKVSQLNLNVNWLTSESWGTLFDHLNEIGVLTDRDRTLPAVPVAQPTPAQPAPEPSLDDLLRTTPSDDFEGRRKLKAKLMESMQADARSVFDAFYRSIIDAFGVYLTETQVKFVTDYLTRHNLNFMVPKNWDRARVWGVKENALPANLLYPEEQLAEWTSAQDWSTSNPNVYEQKRELRKRQALLARPA